jgi:hypothetical protein
MFAFARVRESYIPQVPGFCIREVHMHQKTFLSLLSEKDAFLGLLARFLMHQGASLRDREPNRALPSQYASHLKSYYFVRRFIFDYRSSATLCHLFSTSCDLCWFMLVTPRSSTQRAEVEWSMFGVGSSSIREQGFRKSCIRLWVAANNLGVQSWA